MQTVNLKSVNRSLLSIYRPSNLRTVHNTLREIKSSEVWVEYSGNPFANIVILLILLYQRNYVKIDCHNSAIEYTKGKFSRFLISKLYLNIIRFLFPIELIVHNGEIQKKLKGSIVVYTPYPKLPKLSKRKTQNDVLFLCSLNKDEPLILISSICAELKKMGHVVRVTGNPEKNNYPKLDEYLFDTYPSYEQYLDELYNSRLSVCLSERNETLLYAPREAIVLGVNCLINGSQVNKDFYKRKCFYTSLNQQQILECITKILDET